MLSQIPICKNGDFYDEKKYFFSVFITYLFFLVLSLSCYLEDDGTKSGVVVYTNVTLEFVNNTNQTFIKFYISPDSAADWNDEDEYLGGEVVLPGESKIVKNIPSGIYDLRAETSTHLWQSDNQSLESGGIISGEVLNKKDQQLMSVEELYEKENIWIVKNGQ